MNNEEISQKTIRSYLIGALDERATETLDELSVTSQEFADRLAAEQYELVDEWVAGGLDANEKTSFEQVLKRSPALVEKVRIAQLLTAAPRVVVERPVEHTGFFVGLLTAWPKLGYGLAGIVMLIGLVSLTFYLTRNGNVTQIAQVEPPVNDSTYAAAPTVTPSGGQLADPSTPGSGTGDQPEAYNARKRSTPEPTRTVARPYVALVLSPPTRGTGEIMSVKMDSGVEYLELNVQTEAQTSGRFVVEIGDANSGKIDWRSAPVRGRVQKGRTLVLVRVPSSGLKKGVRTVRLREAGSPSEVLDEHLVRIDR